MDENKCALDYTMACRTCLQTNGEMIYLSALISDNVQQLDCKITYMDCLRTCIRVEEIEEVMPARICLECASCLECAYWFMKNASQAQEMLKNKLREIRQKKQQLEIEASVEELKKHKKYRCKICNVKVETKRSLKDHVKLHLDIIVYNCQLCTFETSTRSFLSDHYNQVHGVEPSKEQLKPKTRNFNSSSPAINQSKSYMMGAIKNEHFHLLPEDSTAERTTVDTFTTDINASYSNPLNMSTVVELRQQQQHFTATTISSPFTALEGDLNTTVSNELNIGNEFIVMADGSVEEVMGKGVVIEYINAVEDGGLNFDNNDLVIDNIIQVQNADNSNMLVTPNDLIQMDVDDLIIEDHGNTTEEIQELPSTIVNDILPVTVIKPIKKINCKICTKDFSTQEQLKMHMLTHNEIPHFFCDHCKFYTFFKNDLHQHYKNKHNLQPTSKQLQPKNKQSPLKEVFTCDLCFFESEFKIDLKKHYWNIHKTEASEIHLRPTIVENMSMPPNSHLVKPKAGTSSPPPYLSKIKTAAQTKNVKIKPLEQSKPDYPNGLNCRKCQEVFYWRNKLYEHYKLHNAEEAALKQEKQLIKVQQNNSQYQKCIKSQQIITQPQPPIIKQNAPISKQNSLEPAITNTTTTTFSNLNTLSLSLTQNNTTTLNAVAPLTPSSSSTYTLPLDAIPQIVETDQTIENQMDFDFNGDALFEDFDDDVDVENDSDDNDHEFRNVLLTSDDDFEDMVKDQNTPHAVDNPTESFCAHCQKTFVSQYQFENHMFVHRGLAPYRCEMCTNLYNTKRCLIRHYKAVHKKVPSRDMIQAKGDKVCVDKTPVENLLIEESKSWTLMCAKCPYESTNLSDTQTHLNTSHSINDESYILKKLSFECPRCIRSFPTKAKLFRHLERNHSSRPINELYFDSTLKTAKATSSSIVPTIDNHVNMMNSDTSESSASCVANGCFDEYHEQQEKQYIDLPPSKTRRARNELTIEDAVAPNIIMANFHDDGNANDNYDNSNSSTYIDYNETSHNSESNKESNIAFINTNKITLISLDEVDDDNVEDEEKQALFKCKICNLTCYNLDTFNKHGTRAECRKLKSNDIPLYECEICHCNYKTMYLLKHHLKRHIGRKFRCPQCPKTFINTMELGSHQYAHSGERPHKCDLCPKSFRYVHHLKRHRDIVHFGKRHVCPEPNCNSTFTTLSQLKGHIWSHNGIIPYKCSFCYRFFKKRLLLREHCSKIHNFNLTEEEMATIFRNSLGYTNPHDFTVAIKNGKMLRRADLETMGASDVIKSSFK